MSAMPKKRKKKKFRAVQAVKELARERLGAPPGQRVVPDLKRKNRQSRQKPKLEDLLEGEE
jgi:hypothetical protein